MWLFTYFLKWADSYKSYKEGEKYILITLKISPFRSFVETQLPLKQNFKSAHVYACRDWYRSYRYYRYLRYIEYHIRLVLNYFQYFFLPIFWLVRNYWDATTCVAKNHSLHALSSTKTNVHKVSTSFSQEIYCFTFSIYRLSRN